MLVLERGNEESIVLDLREFGLGLATIKVVKGGRTHIGLQIDRRVPIHRQEVWDAIEAAKTESAP